jgi:hypothetical protein
MLKNAAMLSKLEFHVDSKAGGARFVLFVVKLSSSKKAVHKAYANKLKFDWDRLNHL